MVRSRSRSSLLTVPLQELIAPTWAAACGDFSACCQSRMGMAIGSKPSRTKG